jgi:hypothetical protein
MESASLNPATAAMRASAEPPSAPLAARPANISKKIGVIGLTIANLEKDERTHPLVYLANCHAGQGKFDESTTPTITHLPLIIEAQRLRDAILISTPIKEYCDEDELQEHLKREARRILEVLKSCGDITDYVGFGQTADPHEPIKYDEHGKAAFVTDRQYQALSQPVVLEFLPNRGASTFSMRVFVVGLPRDRQGMPIPPGGSHIVEFYGGDGMTPAYLSTYNELSKQQRDRARVELARSYKVSPWDLTLRRVSRSRGGGVSVTVVAISTNVPSLAQKISKQHGCQLEIGPLGLKAVIASEANAIQQACDTRDRARRNGSATSSAGGECAKTVVLSAQAPIERKEVVEFEGLDGAIIYVNSQRVGRNRITYTVDVHFATDLAAATFVEKNATLQSHIVFEQGCAPSSSAMTLFTSEDTVQRENEGLEQSEARRGGGAQDAARDERRGNREHRGNRDDSRAVARRGAERDRGQWVAAAARGAERGGARNEPMRGGAAPRRTGSPTRAASRSQRPTR